MRSLLAFGLILFSASALACEISSFSPDEQLADAQFVGLGIVTGERYPSYEARILAGEGPNTFEIPEERLVRVALTENLRGDADKAPLEASVGCGMPIPGISDKVVYGRDKTGAAWVFPAEFAEGKLRRALAAEHDAK